VRKSLLFTTLLALLFGYTMMPTRASSHREAPLISADPQADTTDVYAFVSPDAPDTVTLISSWLPFEDPAGGPNFYKFGDDVQYDFKIDNTGDGVEDIVYRFEFDSRVKNPNTFLYATGPIRNIDDPNRNFVQTYTVKRIERGRTTLTAGPMQTMYDNVGFASTPNYGSFGTGVFEFAHPGGSHAQVFAGQTDDPFFLDLRVFDLLYGGDLSEAGVDTLAGFNVHSLALRVPKASLVSNQSPIIGVWATASRPMLTRRSTGRELTSGPMVQVSRLGMPLVNEVVIPVGMKDAWNGSEPSDDVQFLKYVTEPEVPKLLQAVYNIPAPATPRNDLVSVFLTGVQGLNQPPNVKASEMLRLNTSIMPTPSPARLGVLASDTQGFPNGRRLSDDVIDITLQAAAGVLVGRNTGLGDGVNVNDVPFRGNFPYLALPHSGGNGRNLNPNALK
jgi:hypothetical protein